MTEQKQTLFNHPAKQVPWGIGSALGIGLAAFLLPQVIIAFSLALIAQSQGKSIDDLLPDDNYALNFALSVAIAMIASTIVYLFVRSRKGLDKLGIQKTRLEDVGLALPAYIIYFIIQLTITALIIVLLPDIDLDQAQETGFSNAAGIDLVLAFLTLVVVAPLYEELLFRGFAFQGVASKTGFWPAAIMTSGLFGLAHGQLNVGIDTFILGIMACWLVYHTKSLWPAIMLHVLKNFIAYLFIFVL